MYVCVWIQLKFYFHLFYYATLVLVFFAFSCYYHFFCQHHYYIVSISIFFVLSGFVLFCVLQLLKPEIMDEIDEIG